ncbi:NADH:flavin oxidoreductase/NADH oxidase [Phytohalomonas tamaricis]|uniref:NADH:flavin oxidoreductase/NADH oxidase n=1 Tax=Phytohalomonas tamaricis TaxID=2081032 RepID=UPI000D0B89DC|nr:NADH:flavin oxidoreductase/NADH oxidase [Phytohalomonas tamaricis]
MSLLFDPINFRQVTLPNRIAVSPMCQYSAHDGMANDWHLVHLGARAVGGAGLVIVEAAGVTPEGRITPQDLGIWKDEQIAPLKRITHFIEQQGAVAGIQLAHAGRKASTWRPWVNKHGSVAIAQGGWETVAPSALPFDEHSQAPHALSKEHITQLIEAFAEGARRACEAGFKIIELHAAHGYLIHQFLSPLSNQRDDEYGGSFENRTRFLMETIKAVQQAWPQQYPIFVRISATDWAENGWNIDESIELAKRLKTLGIDLIDVSSGGLVPNAKIPVGPGYQTGLAARIRAESGLATGTVGQITDPHQAEHVLRTEQADLVLLARELLRDPHWPLHAAKALDTPVAWPPQYARATSRTNPMREEPDYTNSASGTSD